MLHYCPHQERKRDHTGITETCNKTTVQILSTNKLLQEKPINTDILIVLIFKLNRKETRTTSPQTVRRKYNIYTILKILIFVQSVV